MEGTVSRNFSRNADAFLLRTVRRIGRHPRFRALENTVCKWFLVLFGAVLLTYVLNAAIRSWAYAS
jgi:hypothetical protein